MNLIQNSIFQTKLGKSNERVYSYVIILCIVHRPIFKIDDSGSPQRRIVVIQCDSGHMIGDLIACARYRIYDLKARADKDQITHVLFIIHLSVLPYQVTGSSFVGFQGNPWVSAHIDDLRPTADNLVATQQAIGVPISDLFYGSYNPQATDKTEKDSKVDEEEKKTEDEVTKGGNKEGSNFEYSSTDESDSKSDMKEGDEREKLGTSGKDSAAISANITKDMYNKSEKKALIPLAPHLLGNNTNLSVPSPDVHENVVPIVLKSPLFKRLHDCIQAAASRLKDFTTKRSTKRVEILVRLVPRELPPKPGKSYSKYIDIMIVYNCSKRVEQESS